MRALGWSVVALVFVGGSVAAGPDPAPAPAKPAPAPAKPAPAKPAPKPDAKKKVTAADAIDISAYKDELIVLSDDDGTIYIVRPRVAGRDGGPVFVGDGKQFYEQRIRSSGANDRAGTWSYGLWAPRVAGYDDGGLYLNQDKKYFITCGRDKDVELRKLSDKESARMIGVAEFHPALFKRRPHLLARDDDGTYYYVDIDADERQGFSGAAAERRFEHGHRVFVGKKGAMKELPMSNVVADSEGEIYQTKRGELRIITEDDKTGVWVRGRKKTTLKLLSLDDNRYLIYRDLGIYGFLATVCEDL